MLKQSQFMPCILFKRFFQNLYFIVCLCALAISSQAKTLKLAADRWCPYNCATFSQQPGYVLELVQLAFAPDYQVKLIEVPWSRALRNAELGLYDGVIGALPGEAPGFIYPKVAVGLARQVLVMRQDNSWQYEGLISLHELRIAVAADYAYSAELDDYIKAQQHSRDLVVIRSEQPLERMHKLLQEGKIDAYIEDKTVASYHAHQHSKNQQIRFAAEFSASPIYIAFSPAKPLSYTLAKRLSTRIVELRNSGQLATLLARYGLKDWAPIRH
ncbi:substrate-binding periplasmic protein [Agarivorans gilvus]|jgi:polar amino acid transport system substrate-binding protein|uniref:Amino acid ABC transporter substrate-binding protein n=1 Tax=Agarivorans gilvus TaxID=680279 RepID=A0ABQ1I2A4_9ALTE|nr:transporter substrate-binding domain-containing protein [Agarivorans gilvus]GGB03070.1 amino acid ABC transporter substrate-binding protein [Agarivorans gilvus]